MGECKNGTLLPQELRTQHNHCDNCNHEDVDITGLPKHQIFIILIFLQK